MTGDVDRGTETRDPTTVLISRVHAPLTALGPGRRAGIWFQGCTVHCPGCVSADTWSFDERRRIDVDRVAAWVRGLGEAVTGVTITGGEPFDQPGPLAALLARIRAVDGGRLDVLCYSGHELAELQRDFGDVLGLLDALAAGPYRAAEPSEDPLLGSGNQRLWLATELGRRRFADRSTDRSMDMAVAGGVWMAGVPGPGDLTALTRELAHRGVHLSHRSWPTEGGDG